jgi:hypothetical protein
MARRTAPKRFSAPLLSILRSSLSERSGLACLGQGSRLRGYGGWKGGFIATKLSAEADWLRRKSPQRKLNHPHEFANYLLGKSSKKLETEKGKDW